MDLLNGNVKNIFLRYFAAAFGGACIPCVYGIVDMAVVGQYHGPNGTAALSVVMPIFNIIYSLGILAGIGGSVLYSIEKGKNPDDDTKANEFFTTAVIAAISFSLLVWLLIIPFEEPLLRFFGADDTLLLLAQQYLSVIRIAAPIFLFTQLLGAFLRNDNAPGLVTKSVLGGGIFNVIGDLVFVFVLDLGITGAAVASACGALISVIIMLTHFRSPDNHLRIVRTTGVLRKFTGIVSNGFSAFFNDFSMGIVTVLFNRQIMKYLGTDALSVYGILININTFVVCCGYSIGMAAQPLLSINFGAGLTGRVREIRKYAVSLSILFGVIWLAVIEAVPNVFVRIFMTPTAEVLAIAPSILRTYGIAFLVIPFVVFSTYYFQSVGKPAISFVVSITRGFVLCSILILALPAIFGANAIWTAMPVTELVTAAFAMIFMTRRSKKQTG